MGQLLNRRKQVKKQVRKKQKYNISLSDSDRQGQKRIVVVKSKHPRSRRKSDESLAYTNNKKTVPYEPQVVLDETTVRKWNILMGKLDSQGNEEECDQGEREWWEKETEILHERVKSFISGVQLIQGEIKFSPWKGSVVDSIGGAFLTQNVNDTLSSSAFMSLAAKYPHGASRVNSLVEASFGSSTATPNDFKTETNSTRKRKRREDGTIHWDTLKKSYSKDDSRRKTYETSDALDWEAIRMAGVDDIAKVIQKRGMSNNLAARIKNCLNVLLNDLGTIDLEWMRDVPPHKAKEYLLSIPGLGLKSVECISLLTLQHKAFPIDTNAGRVVVRLGWVPLEPLPEGQEFHFLKQYPKANSIQMCLWPRLSELDVSTLYELHCQLITFGKVFCTKINPNCNACPMRAECKHYASVLSAHSSNRRALSESHETAMVPIEGDIEDFCVHKLEKNIQKIVVEKNIPLEEGEMSKDLVVLASETASIPVPRLRKVKYSRSEHQVYELPDAHIVLAGLEEREPNDSCPYLLAIWTPESLDKDEFNFEEDIVHGTLLIPVRTAMRGIFPLNGTYFQANEVFADDESSEVPIKVPRASIWNLPRATLYCGNNLTAICRGMKTNQVQKCFRTGYLCFRSFNRSTREPKPLSARFNPQKPRDVKKIRTTIQYSRKRVKKKVSEIDRLSGLPDNVLIHILSFLPTKLSVATAILGKRWRFLWAHVPNFDFDGEIHSPESTMNFSDTINRVMLLI